MIAANKYCVMIIGGFINHAFIRKGIDHILTDPSAVYEVGIDAAHIIVLRRQFKGLGRFFLYRWQGYERTAAFT